MEKKIDCGIVQSRIARFQGDGIWQQGTICSCVAVGHLANLGDDGVCEEIFLSIKHPLFLATARPRSSPIVSTVCLSATTVGRWLPGIFADEQRHSLYALSHRVQVQCAKIASRFSGCQRRSGSQCTGLYCDLPTSTCKDEFLAAGLVHGQPQ